MDSMVRIPKMEYHQLKRLAKRYQLLCGVFAADAFEEPPIKNRNVVLKRLRETGKYNEKFLGSLEQGMKESRMFS
ncbi:hypothetical protein HY734_03330 [Candidatus Uhrbacteria bacterium]|nr:hypothetical protein [Candidatus Uhrbacteria bacterium]